jgi:hypothetical protein
MSFGLKNASATYQRAIQACFKRHLNKNVEAYVDDVVVKTRNSDTLADFTTLLVLALALLWNIHKSRRGSGVGDKLYQIILHQTVWVSSTTTIQ